MEHVEIGKVYRHFKGNYLWVRPEKMFLEEIPERPDNITGQKHRFEVAQELTIDYTKK